MGLFMDSQFYCIDYMSIIMPILSHSLGNCSFLIIFENVKCEFSNFVIFQDVLVTLGSLHFHMDFEISLLISAN